MEFGWTVRAMGRWLFVGMAVVLGIGVLGAGELGAGRKRPNVVLVMTDDQGYGDLSCHGNPYLKTPRLDALRGESTALDRFFVSPTCSPTRAALMTGRHEFRCGVSHTIMGRSLLRPGIATMADRFCAAGYHTAIVGKWHLGDAAPCRPEDRGFEYVFVHGGGGIGQTPDYWGNGYFDPMIRTLGGWKKTEGYCTDVFFGEAMRWIGERAAAGESFFLYLAPNAAHSPYIPPKGGAEKFRKAGIPEPAASFYAMIENIDANMGRLLDKLDDLGLSENTIVLFLTDNGTAVPYWNAGMKGHKGSPHEGGVRVPCFVRWKGKIPAGRVVAAPAAQIDLLPTLAGLCGVDAGPAEEMDGVDLSMSLLGKEKFPDRRLFFTQVGRWPSGEPASRYRGSAFSVRDARWRLVGTELYDMPADPGEEHNVFGAHGAVAMRLMGAYGKWWDGVLPTVREPVRYRIGSAAQAVTKLTAHDWWPSMEGGDETGNIVYQLWNQNLIRKTLRKIKAGETVCKGGVSGHWKLEAMRDGHYMVRMALLPPEAPDAERRELGLLKEGSAHVRANRSEVKMPLRARATSVSMGIDLEKGPVDLEAWFGGQLPDDAPLGAFFVEIQRVGERKMPVPDIRAE